MTLPCSDTLSPTELATVLEAYSSECNVIDRRSEGIAARRRAIALWQAVGDHRKHGENLARLVPMLIGVGQNDAADRCSRDAVALLEVLLAGPELALAFRMRALVYLAEGDSAHAVEWGNRAIALADQCGDEDVSGMTHVAVGSAMMLQDYELGRAYLEERVTVERAAGHARHVGNAYAHLGRQSATLHRFRQAEQYLADGIAYTDGRDLEMYSLYMLAWQSLALMHLGSWREASAVGQRVVLRAAMSSRNRIPALVALGLLHARGQLGESHSALDEALLLAESIGTAEALGAVRAARAESAWLAGDRARTLEEACAGYDLAVRQRHTWVAGELAFWRWRILRGLPRLHGEEAQGKRPVVDTPPDWIAVPFGLQIAGDWRGAADAWCKLDCPYEEARALADGDTAAQEQALAIFERLGARPAAADLRRVLRARGVIRVARGPRPSTRANLFRLTSRQLEILALLGEGLNNSEIGQRLSIAPKTAEHHVAAVLAKLKVPSRRAAVRLARSHELIHQDRSSTPPM